MYLFSIAQEFKFAQELSAFLQHKSFQILICWLFSLAIERKFYTDRLLACTHHVETLSRISFELGTVDSPSHFINDFHCLSLRIRIILLSVLWQKNCFTRFRVQAKPTGV